MNNELIIDKTTNLNSIQNKEQYEKLVIRCRVNPNKLKEFVNIKELTIDYIDKNKTNYNEYKINELPFKDKIERLVLKNIEYFGAKEKIRNTFYYTLKLPNLKSIELPMYIKNHCSTYLEEMHNLEEIIFSLEKAFVFFSGSIIISSNKFKKIVIKRNGKEYEIIPDYKIYQITDFQEFYDRIRIDYSSGLERTSALINYDKNTIEKTNTFVVRQKDGIIYIPDYITTLFGYESGLAKKISFNLNLLNCVDTHETLLFNLSILETIEIRNSNEMSLIPNKEISVKEHGELKELYIKNNLMYLEYDICTITIDSKGNIEKIDKQKDNDIIELDLTKYTLEQLENYVSYLKLLKLSEDIEYKKAMSVIEKTVVKKLIK